MCHSATSPLDNKTFLEFWKIYNDKLNGLNFIKLTGMKSKLGAAIYNK